MDVSSENSNPRYVIVDPYKIFNQKQIFSEGDQYILNKYPKTKVPLSAIFFKLDDNANIKKIMDDISDLFPGNYSWGRGSIIITSKSNGDNDVTLTKITAYINEEDNSRYLEFNRLEGCAFASAIVNGKVGIKIIDHIKDRKIEELKQFLDLTEERLSYWNPPASLFSKEN